MKNTILYILSALISTCIIILWVLNVIQPINNSVAGLLILIIASGYMPAIGEIYSNAYLPKQR